MSYDWITWADVRAGSKEFESADVEIYSQRIIDEACQTAVDDLSGYYDMPAMVSADGVPGQLKRLCLYKAREIAAITFWGAPDKERNRSASYFAEEYKFLLESIRAGYIQVEGFNKKVNAKAVHYY